MALLTPTLAINNFDKAARCLLEGRCEQFRPTVLNCKHLLSAWDQKQGRLASRGGAASPWDLPLPVKPAGKCRVFIQQIKESSSVSWLYSIIKEPTTT